MSFPSDLEIARCVTPRPIADIAGGLGFHADETSYMARPRPRSPGASSATSASRAASTSW